MKKLRTVALAAGLSAVAAAHAAAQIDYRNLDDDRPMRVEDAYPIERYAFEFLLPYAVARGSNGALTHASVLELAYGVAANTHIGLKAPLASDEGPNGRRWGLSGLRAFALYNANTEAPWLPAFSLRVDGFVPVGSLGGEALRGEVKLIATRSFGRSRVHVNGAVGLGPDAAGPASEGAARWWYGAALDRTLFRQSVLLVGEVYAQRDVRAAPVEVNASLGARWQWTPNTVLDAGVTRRLRSSGPDIAFTLGLSRAVALGGLMPGRRTARTMQGGDHDAHH